MLHLSVNKITYRGVCYEKNIVHYFCAGGNRLYDFCRDVCFCICGGLFWGRTEAFEETQNIQEESLTYIHLRNN